MVVDRQQNLSTVGANMQYGNDPDPLLDGVFDGPRHLYTLRIQYEDTDAGGIVYHAQYLAFGERARSALLRCLGIDQSVMLTAGGLAFVVRRIGGASLKLQQNLRNRDNGHILARLIVDIALVKLTKGKRSKICRLPEAIKTKLSGLMM